jgi:hypothetical protein
VICGTIEGARKIGKIDDAIAAGDARLQPCDGGCGTEVVVSKRDYPPPVKYMCMKCAVESLRETDDTIVPAIAPGTFEESSPMSKYFDPKERKRTKNTLESRGFINFESFPKEENE